MITSAPNKKGPTISFWKLFLILVATLSVFGGMIIFFIIVTPKTTLTVTTITDKEIKELQSNSAALENGYIQYQLRCARCHGEKLDGGLEGPSLIDTEWIYGNTAQSIFKVITVGIPSKGMPAWGKQLQVEDIKALTAVIIDLNTKNTSKTDTP